MGVVSQNTEGLVIGSNWKITIVFSAGSFLLICTWTWLTGHVATSCRCARGCGPATGGALPFAYVCSVAWPYYDTYLSIEYSEHQVHSPASFTQPCSVWVLNLSVGLCEHLCQSLLQSGLAALPHLVSGSPMTVTAFILCVDSRESGCFPFPPHQWFTLLFPSLQRKCQNLKPADAPALLSWLVDLSDQLPIEIYKMQRPLFKDAAFLRDQGCFWRCKGMQWFGTLHSAVEGWW